MKGKILRALVGLFPSYLCLYADSTESALCMLIPITIIAAIITGILTIQTDENLRSSDEDKNKLIDIIKDLWIYHLLGFAICLLIHSSIN